MFTKSEMHITLPTVIMAVLVVLAAAVFAAGADTLTGGARFATVNADAIYLDGELVATTGYVAQAVSPLGPRLDRIETGTNDWQTAYSWGNHALAGYLLPAALAPYATTAALAVHTNRIDNPHSVTASQIGALTAEQDLAALRTYHYGSPDIVESPAEWFVFNGAGTITGFDYQAGRENVVIPWAIGGVPVTAIGTEAFLMGGIASVIAPQTVTVIGGTAFYNCNSLASVSLPQATAIGSYAFYSCHALAAVNLPQVTSIGGAAFYSCHALAAVNLPQVTSIGDGAFSDCSKLTSANIPQATVMGGAAFYYCSKLTAVHMGRNAPVQATEVFYGIDPPPTVYVTDPQATGWGAEWNGAPVVRPPLYADAIYQAGELVATTGHVAQAVSDAVMNLNLYAVPVVGGKHELWVKE